MLGEGWSQGPGNAAMGHLWGQRQCGGRTVGLRGRASCQGHQAGDGERFVSPAKKTED